VLKRVPCDVRVDGEQEYGRQRERDVMEEGGRERSRERRSK
jgi:hypothetical protein